MAMKVSPRGLVALAIKEGLVPAPYLDSVGVWTFGVGHAETSGLEPNPRHMKRGMPADLGAAIAEALRLFPRTLRVYEDAVNRAVTVPLEQHEFDALVSFHYNTGGINRAALTRHLNNGDRAAAARAFMWWVRPPEIRGRREAEQRLFREGVYPTGSIPVYSVNGNGRLGGVIRSVSGEDALRMMRATERPTTTPSAPSASGGFLSALLAFLGALFGGDSKKRGLVPVPHEGRTIWVTPDYYREDGIRMPVDYPRAMEIAQARGLELPTKEMVESIYAAADVKLIAQPIPWKRENTTLPVFRKHDEMIEGQLRQRGGLIAGHKKDILRDPTPGKVRIYGWHKADGSVWQPVSEAHGAAYKDYSHGLRLVYDPEK